MTGPRPTPPDTGRWRDRAVCREVDPELFFPDPGDLVGSRHAKAICAGCSVREACLEAELVAEDRRGSESRHGIRGGLTGRERHAIYRARAMDAA